MGGGMSLFCRIAARTVVADVVHEQPHLLAFLEAIEESKKLVQNVARFAQYTSPVMLAMLASAGHDMAFALTSQQL
jgi:hypothetical protein